MPAVERARPAMEALFAGKIDELSDEQLIERIRSELHAELARINPPGDLLDWVWKDAESSSLESACRDQRTRMRSMFASVPLLVSVIVAVVVGAVALTALKHGGASKSTSAGSAGSSRRELISILGVLRSAQTEPRLNFDVVPRQERQESAAIDGEPDLPLIRFATTAPWGEKLYLVPMKPPTDAARARLTRQQPEFARMLSRVRSRGETIGFYSAHGVRDLGNAPSIESGQAMVVDDDRLSPGIFPITESRSTQSRFILIVPNGVARVEFYFPPQAVRVGGPIYRTSITATVPVHGNVAAAQVMLPHAELPALIWYAADGTVIKRLSPFGADIAQINASSGARSPVKARALPASRYCYRPSRGPGFDVPCDHRVPPCRRVVRGRVLGRRGRRGRRDGAAGWLVARVRRSVARGRVGRVCAPLPLRCRATGRAGLPASPRRHAARLRGGRRERVFGAQRGVRGRRQRQPAGQLDRRRRGSACRARRRPPWGCRRVGGGCRRSCERGSRGAIRRRPPGRGVGHALATLARGRPGRRPGRLASPRLRRRASDSSIGSSVSIRPCRSWSRFGPVGSDVQFGGLVTSYL